MAEKQVSGAQKPAENKGNGNPVVLPGETIAIINLDELYIPWEWNVRSKADLADVSDAVRDTTEKRLGATEGVTLKEFVDTFIYGGQDTPTIVRPVKNGVAVDGTKTPLKYELICGFRRIGAIQMANSGETAAESDKAGRPHVAGLPNNHFKAVVRELTNKEARILNIRENTLRNNLKTPDLLKQVRNLEKDGMTQTEISRTIGITQGFVSKLSLIGSLPEPIIAHWANGTIPAGFEDRFKKDKTYPRVPSPELMQLAKSRKEEKRSDKDVIEQYIETVAPIKVKGAGKGAKAAERVSEFATLVAKLVASGFLKPGHMQWTKLVGPGNAGFMVDAGTKDYAKVMEMCAYAEKVYDFKLQNPTSDHTPTLNGDSEDELLDETPDE